MQVAELAAGKTAKQEAVLESDSGHYNYESCRSSCSDSEQTAAATQSSTRPDTPAVIEIQAPVASFSTSSMSSDVPSTPAQHADGAPATPQGQGVPSGIKNTFNKIFGSNWGSESSSSSGEGGHGLIAAFRAIMPKTTGSQSGSGECFSSMQSHA